MRDVERLINVLDALESVQGGNVLERLRDGAAELLHTPGVAIAVAADGPELLTLSCTTACARFDRLQYELGEGPAWAAHRTGWPVGAAEVERDDQWLAFNPAAADLGLRAVFAFPLRRGSARIGALTLYREVAGALTDDEHADAVVVARVGVGLVLASQAGRSADDLDEMLHAAVHDEAAVHQASGMVAVQLGIAVAAALSVLRAHAFTAGMPLRDVAADVIARRLRMSEKPDP